MEFAVQVFMQHDSPEKSRLAELVTRDGVNVNWHVEDVCRRLIDKPIRISSKQHTLFWAAMKSGVSLGRIRTHAQACVVVDNTETMLVTHYDLLLSMLEVLLNAKLYASLESLREIPLFVLKILVSKSGLRRFVFKNISEQCREEVNTDDLRRKAELGFELYINAIDDLFEYREFNAYDTPPPLLEGRYERPSKRTKQPDVWYDRDAFLALFPVRRGEVPRENIQPFNEAIIATLLSAYSMLWSDLNRLHLADRDHSAEQMTRMQSAFPMMLSMLAEELDHQTLSRTKYYFSRQQAILEIIQASAERLRSYLLGGDIIDPRFEEGYSININRTAALYTTHHRNFENSELMHRASLNQSADCALHPVTQIPVAHLLNRLDNAAMIGGRSLRLREFLHERDRLEYFAYIFPTSVSLFAVESSLAALCSWWSIPMLAGDSFVVLPTDTGSTALVATPSVMLCLRMIAITRAYMGGIVEASSFWRFCVRNLVHLPPKTCPELHDVALFCTMSAVGYKLDSGYTFRSMATPDTCFFEAYRFLPALCRLHTEFRDSSYATLCDNIRVLIPRRSVPQSVNWNMIHMARELLEKSVGGEELLARLNAWLRYGKRKAQPNYRAVFTAARQDRPAKRPLYLHDILRAVMSTCDDNPQQIEYLFNDLRTGSDLSEVTTDSSPVSYVESAHTEMHRFETLPELEARIRADEYNLFGEAFLESEHIALAHSYYASRGFFVPTRRHNTTGLDQLSEEEQTTVELQAVPPEGCTADNVREHTGHYLNESFLKFLYRCFMDAEEESAADLPELQSILAADEPPLLTVRLSNGQEEPIDKSFLLSRGNATSEEQSEVPSSGTCSISDQLAQDLVTLYANRLVVSDQVTEKIDHTKSYLECIQHLHEIMSD